MESGHKFPAVERIIENITFNQDIAIVMGKALQQPIDFSKVCRNGSTCSSCYYKKGVDHNSSNMRLFTWEDIRDVYIKINQRGYEFILSKLTFSKEERTKSSFNDTNISNSNWWIIPLVKERWNFLITGDPKLTYEELPIS